MSYAQHPNFEKIEHYIRIHMKQKLKNLKSHTIDVITDWTSKKWHREHKWHAGTGKFIKRLLNKKNRQEKF